MDLAAKPLLAVAAGIVQFGANDLATVKVANLDIKHRVINKDQCIAIAEYLPSSFEYTSLYSPASSRTLNPLSLDFSEAFDASLSTTQVQQIMAFLQDFTDCFDNTLHSTTTLVQHHIHTGDAKPVSNPPHRASAAENDTINGLIDEMLQQGIIRPSRSP